MVAERPVTRCGQKSLARICRSDYIPRMPAPIALVPDGQISVETTNAPRSERLLSLDIFRGLAVAGMIIVDNPGSDDHAFWAIKHAEWNGWTPADLIFPSFLFLVGISIVFSVESRLERGETRGKLLSHVLKRSLLLIAIGLLVNASPIYGFDLHTFRFEGVTQRIALCYLVTTLLELNAGLRWQIVALAVCLAGYWVLLRFAPVPGVGTPGHEIPFMDPDQNITAWLDRSLFMGHLYNGTRDPEGILSTIPAIGTTLIGLLTGHWLRTRRSAETILAGLVGFGVAGLLAGKVWNLSFPINKNLWTSSFALFTGGFALLFLALLYWVVEVKKWRGLWTMPILVLGVNAIAGFVADSLVYGPGYTFMATGPDGQKLSWHEATQAFLERTGLSAANASLVYSLCALVFCWLLLWGLWRKKILLKV
jgi:predicted acyltransferase